MTRVMVADDQQLVRGGFALMIESAPDLDVVAEAADGRAAIELARSHRPDVILMDIRMPDLNGIEATRIIAADPDLAEVRILILTTFDLDEYVYDAIRAGASGFLLKDTDPSDLLDAIRVIANGDSLLSPTVTRRLIADIAARPERAANADIGRFGALTERETEIVELVAKGMSNADIASALFISAATAKTHVSRSMIKVGARDRAQLVAMAYESGLVVPGA